jgi:hypothetical protein
MKKFIVSFLAVGFIIAGITGCKDDDPHFQQSVPLPHFLMIIRSAILVSMKNL